MLFSTLFFIFFLVFFLVTLQLLQAQLLLVRKRVEIELLELRVENLNCV